MWFSSVYLKTLREVRIAILGWGIGMGLLMYAVLAATPSLINTPQARAALVSLAPSYAWLAAPVDIASPGGYATWKYGLTILIIAIWPLLACSRLLRGEEERGSFDVLLSLPRGRIRIVLEKMAAVWTALLLMAVLIGLLTFAGAGYAKADFGLSESLLFGLNLALISGFFGSLALLISQFTQERGTASGLTGALLIVFIVLDMVHRVIPNTEWISRFSPVYYYNLSKPLIPSYGTNVGAMLLLLALSVVLIGASLAIFARRDIGGVALPALQRSRRAVPLARALPVNAWSLRSIYTRSLAMVIAPACWWTLGIVAFAAWMIVVVKQTEAALRPIYQSSPLLKIFISKVGGGDVNMNDAILSALFILLPLFLMAFAITQASRWSADEENGQQELVLATPQSRLMVILARFGALTTVMIIIGLLALAASALAASSAGLALDQGNLVAATLSIIPLGLLMAALGYLFSGWVRTAVDTGVLSFLLVIWFVISFIGPGLNWPESTLRLSALYYYGTPLLHGLPVGDMLGVLAVAVVALALASFRFTRKDIGR
jgi:ABC-2 type transport system permease protein